MTISNLPRAITLTFIFFASVVVGAQSATQEGLYIKIGQANFKKSLMAIPSFQFTGTPGTAKGGMGPGKELFDTFRNDMDASGYFELIKPDAFLEDVGKVGLKPAPGEPGGFSYSSWKQIGAEFLIRVGYRINGSEMSVDTYLYFVPQAKLVLGKSYTGRTSEVRTIAHTFANDVIKALTGLKGVFLSNIVVSRSTRPQEKEIFVMDWDGANPRQITRHNTIAQSPTWSFDGKRVAYSAFTYHPREKTRNLDLFTYEVATGKRSVVSYQRGINSGASFMPDNRSLLLTISNAGNPDIYKMSIDGLNKMRITTSRPGEMNVEPTMSPDGRRIAYSSTRSGQPHIYVMNADGSGAKRLTLAGRYNSTPAWSPDGKRIAFAGFDSDHFDIFVMDADGTNMVRLTSAKKTNGKMANNEDPSFSPDGRLVLFRSDRTSKYQLYVATVDGESERRITFDGHDYFKPRWSPTID